LLIAFATLLIHISPAYHYGAGISLLFSPRIVVIDSQGSYPITGAKSFCYSHFPPAQSRILLKSKLSFTIYLRICQASGPVMVTIVSEMVTQSKPRCA